MPVRKLAQYADLLRRPDCSPQYSGARRLPRNDLQCSRPYFSQFPQYSVIDEAKSNLGSIYNALQTALRLQGYHGLTAQFAYTWSHAIDYETGLLPYLPQNPLNEAASAATRTTMCGTPSSAMSITPSPLSPGPNG